MPSHFLLVVDYNSISTTSISVTSPGFLENVNKSEFQMIMKLVLGLGIKLNDICLSLIEITHFIYIRF